MVDTLWPANAVAGAPAYTGRALRQAASAVLAGGTAARPLGARSGVTPGTASNTVTATSTTWTCKPFSGVADVMTAAEAGPYQFAFDANATGSMAAAHATLPRKDIIYVSVTDPAESVGSTPSVTRKYLAGTAASTPSAPSVPGTERGFVIAEINVPASGGGSPSVSWIAPMCVAAGGTWQFATEAQLLAAAAPVGTLAYAIDTQTPWVRHTAGWDPQRPGGSYLGFASSGYMVFPHGLKRTPNWVNLTPRTGVGEGADDFGARVFRPTLWQITATNIEVRYVRHDSNAWVTDARFPASGNGLRVDWTAGW